jgi:hypothetical protein
LVDTHVGPEFEGTPHQRQGGVARERDDLEVVEGGGEALVIEVSGQPSFPEDGNRLHVGQVGDGRLAPLATGSRNLILPYVPAAAEEELTAAFDLASKARAQGPEAMEVADRYFFETTVRLHRAGEGAPFTGLKPAGLDVGPAIRTAERAITRGSPEELVKFLADTVRSEAEHKFQRLMEFETFAEADVDGARTYVQAELGLQVWANRVYACATSTAHE